MCIVQREIDVRNITNESERKRFTDPSSEGIHKLAFGPVSRIRQEDSCLQISELVSTKCLEDGGWTHRRISRTPVYLR